MPLARIHQAIHGYRDGHRLLSSSLSLGADAARTMLVLSDMSGPSMRPGFEEYLTGYPLPGSEFFVIAKTWYAPEMQRPGCVWTHSLLLSCEQASHASASRLVSKLRRPRQVGVESAATSPIDLDGTTDEVTVRSLALAPMAAALVESVLGQTRPVIVTVERADQLEPAFLQLWERLWPAARVRFSFCTGALMPRSIAGALMDIQAVPQVTPPPQLRKSAGGVLVFDLQSPGTGEAWVEFFLEATQRVDSTFRSWLDAAVGADISRGVVPSLVPIFGAWQAQGASARSILDSVAAAKEIEPSVRRRLVGMVFDRANAESGASGQREILHYVSTSRDTEFESIAAAFEDQARRLFEDSRAEAVVLVLSLLSGELTKVGERVLRAAVLLLTPTDIESFGDAQAQYLPTIVGANHKLAFAPALWDRASNRSSEVLAQLGRMTMKDEERETVVRAILSLRRDVPVDALIRFGGKTAIFRGLSAVQSGQLQLSWPWRSALAAHPNTVLEWLESLSSPSQCDLELGSRLLSPKDMQSRLATVWRTGTARTTAIASRVAAFGLALAFWEADVKAPLFAACFQPTYDAAGNSRLEYDEWEWLREYAPSSSYWRDWDRCERLAKAMARLFETQSAALETVFWIVHSRPAIRKVAAFLADDRNTRPYLKSLREAAESSSIGTSEQRNALLGDW